MFNIVGIDPSTNYVGLANFFIDSKTFEIVAIDTTTITLANIVAPDNLTRQEFANQYLFSFLTEYFSTYPVIGLAIESAFINKFRISSYGPLTRIIQTIHMSYRDVYGNINRIIEYAPLLVKKHIGKEFFIDKDGTKNAILQSNLKNYIRPNISEHEYDAIAICNLLYTEIYYNKEILLNI